MLPKRVAALRDQYRCYLLDDVVPFWLTHSLDRKHGGYLNCLDRDGSVYNTDKAMWLQCREVWLFSKLYNALEPREEWLEAARLGFDFLMKHGFDTDGRMFFAVTRDGRPLRKRRYVYTEAFGVIACAQYARAAGDEGARQRAIDTYRLMLDLSRTPGALAPKVLPQTRVTRSHSMAMITLATTQELRATVGEEGDSGWDETIDESINQITHLFMKPDQRALFETVGPGGEKLDSPQGRCVNPGHAIETAWFLMHEGRHRGDAGLVRSALDIIDWSLEWGWDREHGGIFSFVDVEGKPPEQLEWDMKLWWPHTEALYALLLAHHLAGDDSYLEWYERVHSWAFDHFADPEYGEWYGYLHRDGSVSLSLKGSMWKGAFHLPRALLLGLQLLEEMQEGA